MREADYGRSKQSQATASKSKNNGGDDETGSDSKNAPAALVKRVKKSEHRAVIASAGSRFMG